MMHNKLEYQDFMKKMNNEKTGGYVAPMCDELLLRNEGVLCSSGSTDLDSTIDGFNENTESYW